MSVDSISPGRPTGRAGRVRFVVGLLGLAIVSAAVWLTLWASVAPHAFGWSSVAVTSGSMEPLINTGDIVVVEPYKGTDLQMGTVIVFDDASGGRTTHRIVAATPTGEYVTRGDANGRIDSTPVSPDEIVGVGRMLIPAVGNPAVWLGGGQWVPLVLSALGVACAFWVSRWAMLRRFNPWRSGVHVPGVPGRRRTLAMWLSPIVAIVAIALVAGMVTTTRTRATFAVSTGNLVNSFVADTLQPPTSVTATGGADATVNWTITPDTYALGHRVYRATSTGGPYTQVAQVTPRATATDVDSPADGTYYYVVRAYTTNWESVNSNEDSATVVTPEDYDAIAPLSDNCPTTFNINQYDTDSDGTGDACDASPTVASSGVFTDTGQSLGSLKATGIEFGDLDGDGDLDAMVVNLVEPNIVWLNNGTGTFTDSGQTLGSAKSYAMALGDVDGDGDLDAMVANKDEPNVVWLNNGSGTFTDSGQTLGTADSQGVAFGDVDGDGDLDAMVANSAEANVVWLNNGTGTFTDSGQTLGSAKSLDVVFGDLDADGDLDATVGNNGEPNVVWLNNGSGTFTDSGQTLGLATTQSIVLGDIDGDGDLDAAHINLGQADTIWLNNGTGTFTNSGQTLGTADGSDAAFGDVDGDGDLDLIVAVGTATGPNAASKLWLNNGSGTFTDSGQALGTRASRGVALGDLDGDGDLDAMFANHGTANSVWINDAGAPVSLVDTWQSGLTRTAGAGSDRAFVFVATNEEQSIPSPTLTGVTYGGQALTPVLADDVGNGCCGARVEIWILDEAGITAASSTTIVPTWTSTPDTPLYSNAIFDNVHQATPTGASTSASVSANTPNPVPMSPVNTAAGDVVIAAATAGEAGTYTAQNGWTLGLTQDTTTGGSTAHGTAHVFANGSDETASMLFNPASPPNINRQVVLAVVLNGAA